MRGEKLIFAPLIVVRSDTDVDNNRGQGMPTASVIRHFWC